MDPKSHERFEFENIKKKVKEDLHHEYKSLAGFLAVFIRTINPLCYKRLTHGGWSDGFRYFFHLLVFSFALFFLFTIPHLFSFYDQLRLETEHLNNFSLTPQLDVNQVIAFNDFGIIIANDKQYDDELLLITQDSISWPNIKCLLIEPSCMLYQEPHVLDFSQAKDLVDDRDKFTNVTFGVILLLIPGIFIVLFMYFFVKYLFMILLFFIIGYVWCLALRMEIMIRQLFLHSVYALSLTIVVQTIVGFYYQTYYIPYMCSLLIFLIATYIVAEKPFHHFKRHVK